MNRDERRYFSPPATLDDEARLNREAGSYRYLCALGGHALFTHRPVGTVLHVVRRSGLLALILIVLGVLIPSPAQAIPALMCLGDGEGTQAAGGDTGWCDTMFMPDPVHGLVHIHCEWFDITVMVDIAGHWKCRRVDAAGNVLDLNVGPLGPNWIVRGVPPQEPPINPPNLPPGSVLIPPPSGQAP